METEFAKTPMGKKYFQSDLPSLIKSNEKLAQAQENHNKILEKMYIQGERKFKLEQKRLLLEAKKHGIDLRDMLTEEEKTVVKKRKS